MNGLGFLIALQHPFEIFSDLPDGIAVCYVVMILGMFVLWLRMTNRLRRHGLHAAITADGVHLKLRHKTRSFVPWDDIAVVRYSFQHFGVHRALLGCHAPGGTIDVVGVFKNKKDAEHFVQLVNEYAVQTPAHTQGEEPAPDET